jgi:hypothetical protein
MNTHANKGGHPSSAFLLTPEELREFQRIVRESTGTLLDDHMAARRASQLLYLVRALIGGTSDEQTSESSNVVQS